MLVELCCRCGFFHKDDRILLGEKSYRAYKPHYHWTPLDGELLLEDLRVHATTTGCQIEDPPVSAAQRFGCAALRGSVPLMCQNIETTPP